MYSNAESGSNSTLNCSRSCISGESKSLESCLKPGIKSTDKIIKRQPKRSDSTILSVQNLQFPENYDPKLETFIVKRNSNLLHYPKSKSIFSTKDRGYDFTSSTNSYYDQMVITVPKLMRPQCSSNSTANKRSLIQSRETLNSSKLEGRTYKDTSYNLIDSHHERSKERINIHRTKLHKPCKEGLIAAAPRKSLAISPTNYEHIAKLSKPRQKFFLTQDPRKVECLVNPAIPSEKRFSKEKEVNAVTEMVKHGQNICTTTSSESSDNFICEVIDLKNPLQLDFQGIDYSKTYQKDEQEFQDQRNYQKICRYLDRRRVKAETQRMNIPRCIEVMDRIEPTKVVPAKPCLKLAQLYRSADKSYNQKRLEFEKERRQKRYENLYLKRKTRQEEEKQRKEMIEKEVLENLPLTLANENLMKLVKNIEESIENSAWKKINSKEAKTERSKLLYTTLETTRSLKMRDQNSLTVQDKPSVEKHLHLSSKSKLKDLPGKHWEISPKVSIRNNTYSKTSEQSSYDESECEVGKQGSKFNLRSLQFKISSNKMNKLTQRGKLQATHKMEGCITRDQWLQALIPKKPYMKLGMEKGIQTPTSPDNDQLILFAPPTGFKIQQVEQSAIRNYIMKSLGLHYDRVIRKELKFAKPRMRYNVKKFNLINYRFGDTVKRFSQLKDSLPDLQILKPKSTTEYMAAKALHEQCRREEVKQKRLRLLGIPCRLSKKSRLQTKCENSSSSSDSEWIPEKTILIEKDGRSIRCDKVDKEVRPLNMRGNMPAPKLREPTLRQHPRRPRDYDNERVPSEIFDQTVLSTNLPYMRKLDKDCIKIANADLKRTSYTDKFEARHHHDHSDPTQMPQVYVHYHPRLVKPEITKIKKGSDRVVVHNFREAKPPCSKFVNTNLSSIQLDTRIQEIKENHRSKSPKTGAEQPADIKILDRCSQKDYKLRSRDHKELRGLNYPGRQEYVQLLKDVRNLYVANKPEEEGDLVDELEEDMKSIESCLTSLSSSTCTNFTNDSGSFLLLGSKEKIPLDYIRKSKVPFEEVDRSRFQAVPIDVDKELANPFQVLPFAGQMKAQLQLTAPKDRFFTFNTRHKNHMRLRLEVPVQDVREQFFGKSTNKYKGVVATDIDENFVKDLQNRPPVKQYKFKTSQLFIKDALRLKFVSMIIQEEIVRTKLYDRLNEHQLDGMLKMKKLFEEIFGKWEKKEYDSAMAVVYTVEQFYYETDRLKTEFKQLEREFTMLNMDIVFIEAQWAHFIMLQNFHYLLGDQEWRLKHDWIHRMESDDNQLENFADSISKRSTVNIRKRDKDDAWAIKTYYDEVYLKNKHENIIVFPNSESFLKGLDNLKTKTFIMLLEMHFTLGIHTELQHKLESFVEWCAQDLQEKNEYVSRKCTKLYFMADRAKWLNQNTLQFLGDPITECFSDGIFHKHRGIIAEAWRRIVPSNVRPTYEHEIYTVDMVSAIWEILMDLLAKFEIIPVNLSLQVENKFRTHRAYLRKQSHQAYHIERRIDMEMKKVVQNLTLSHKKIKPTSKLPRYYLKKRIKPAVIKEKIITERAKLFFQAFNEGEFTLESGDIKDSIIEVSGAQEHFVPFYFDHFLKLNGYTPNYNFKTKIEMRDGLEIDRFKIKSVIPEIQERMERWEVMKTKIMNDNIARNPMMYENVMT